MRNLTVSDEKFEEKFADFLVKVGVALFLKSFVFAGFLSEHIFGGGLLLGCEVEVSLDASGIFLWGQYGKLIVEKFPAEGTQLEIGHGTEFLIEGPFEVFQQVYDVDRVPDVFVELNYFQDRV
jgi:hypothetical protein